VLRAVVDKLPSGDIKAIKEAVFNPNYGVDTEVSFNCKHCGEENISMLPLSKDFLPLS
jgi:hypothetical protein